MLGHFGVGKTSLIRRFVTDVFSDNYKVTIGVHISKKVIELTSNDTMSLMIWDLEGTDDMGLLQTGYLHSTHGIILVFDVTRPSTFENLKKDINTLQDKIPDVPIITVGNKVDLVVSSELSALEKNAGISIDYFTSAKSGELVNELFSRVALQLHET